LNVVLTSIIIALVCSLVFLNIYFRKKLLQSFRYLSKNKVEFNIGQLFNDERLKKEVLPKYPRHKEEIELFAHHIKSSLKIAIGIILGIILAGVILNGFIVN